MLKLEYHSKTAPTDCAKIEIIMLLSIRKEIENIITYINYTFSLSEEGAKNFS